MEDKKMCIVRIQANVPLGVAFGISWMVFDAETGEEMPDVQAVQVNMCLESAQLTAVLTRYDFEAMDRDDSPDIGKYLFEETVIVESINMHQFIDAK